MVTVAIDPGDAHVGVCYDLRGGTLCFEGSPESVIYWLKLIIACVDEVIIEKFVLYPGQDHRTTWRPMATSEMIGALKLVCADNGVAVVEQPAAIKKPTRRQLRARGIKQTGSGTHERDAELHYWYRRLRRPDGEAA